MAHFYLKFLFTPLYGLYLYTINQKYSFYNSKQLFNARKRGCDKMRNHFVHSSFFVSILIFSQDKSEKRVYAPFPHKNCNFSAYAAFLIRNVLL